MDIVGGAHALDLSSLRFASRESIKTSQIQDGDPGRRRQAMPVRTAVETLAYARDLNVLDTEGNPVTNNQTGGREVTDLTD